MAKKTTRKPQAFPKRLIIMFFVIWLIPTSLVTKFFIEIISALLQSVKQSEPIAATISCVIVAALVSFLALIFYIIPLSYILGKLQAKRKIHANNRHIKLTNPYQYYKELPNNFGIGIATILVDSKIENEKDIVATILDLCAQGYLRLSKHSDHYIIRMLPAPHLTPLRNEAYILNLIRENNLPGISYRQWYNLCIEDSIALGLYRPLKSNSLIINTITEHSANTTATYNNFVNRIIAACIKIGLFVAAIGILIALITLNNSEISNLIFISACIIALAIPMIVGILASVIQALFVARTTSQSSYKSTLESHLTKTKLGIAEFQKLLAFRNFLAKFNVFVDKNPEAVILWNRYLSYAQVFGLSKEIMRSGYEQLVNNAAFKIDDIANINLKNLSPSPSEQPPK